MQKCGKISAPKVIPQLIEVNLRHTNTLIIFKKFFYMVAKLLVLRNFRSSETQKRGETLISIRFERKQNRRKSVIIYVRIMECSSDDIVEEDFLTSLWGNVWAFHSAQSKMFAYLKGWMTITNDPLNYASLLRMSSFLVRWFRKGIAIRGEIYDFSK